jgi:hypothetical protein
MKPNALGRATQPAPIGERAGHQESLDREAERESPGTPSGTNAQRIVSGHDMLFHSLAEIFPMLVTARVEELASDVGQRGLLQPILLYEGKILDGRCRYRACLLAGIEPRYESYTGADPVGVVLSLNVRRRHLTEAQRALVAARICNLQVGANQYSSEGMPAGRAAQALDVGVRTIQRAKKILAYGIPELVQAVEDGAVSMSVAEHISFFSETEQRPRLRARALQMSVPELALPPGETGPIPYDATPSELKPEAVTDAEPAAQGHPQSVSALGLDESGKDADEPQPEPVSASENVPSTRPEVKCDSGAATPHHPWILSGYIASSAVTAIVGTMNAPVILVALAAIKSGGGEVIWVSSRPRARATLRSLFGVDGGFLRRIRFQEGRTGDYGFPIHDLGNALRWLDGELSTSNAVGGVVIDYLFPYLAPGELEESIHMLRPAFELTCKMAVKHGVGIIVPCQLPCQGGSTVMTKAVDQLAAIPDLHSLLLIKGTCEGGGTILVKKRASGGKSSALDFRVTKSGYFDGPTPPIVLLENGIHAFTRSHVL